LAKSRRQKPIEHQRLTRLGSVRSQTGAIHLADESEGDWFALAAASPDDLAATDAFGSQAVGAWQAVVVAPADSRP